MERKIGAIFSELHLFSVGFNHHQSVCHPFEIVHKDWPFSKREKKRRFGDESEIKEDKGTEHLTAGSSAAPPHPPRIFFSKKQKNIGVFFFFETKPTNERKPRSADIGTLFFCGGAERPASNGRAST